MRKVIFAFTDLHNQIQPLPTFWILRGILKSRMYTLLKKEISVMHVIVQNKSCLMSYEAHHQDSLVQKTHCRVKKRCSPFTLLGCKQYREKKFLYSPVHETLFRLTEV